MGAVKLKAKGGGVRGGVQRRGAESACRVGFQRRDAEGQRRRGEGGWGSGVVHGGPGGCAAWKATAQRKGARAPRRQGEPAGRWASSVARGGWVHVWGSTQRRRGAGGAEKGGCGIGVLCDTPGSTAALKAGSPRRRNGRKWRNGRVLSLWKGAGYRLPGLGAGAVGAMAHRLQWGADEAGMTKPAVPVRRS